MKVIVKSVEDAAFTGSDGSTIPSAKVTFEQDGTTKTLQTYIPPVVTQALSWQPGQEVDLEEYTDKKGKQRFKTPQAQTKGQSKYTPDPTRDAVQAAVALAQTAWRLPEGATENRSPDQAQGAADRMLAFVEHAIPRILKATQNEGIGAATPASGNTREVASGPSPHPVAPPRAAPQETGPTDTPPSEGPAPALSVCKKSPDGKHKLIPAPNPEAAKRGAVMCKYCREAGHREKFEPQESLV